MAKKRQSFKITDFSGGLNSNASTTNLEPNEAVQLTNLKTNRTGTLHTIRDAEKANVILSDLPDSISASQQTGLKGMGIFGHGADRKLENNGSAGNVDSNEFLVYHTKPGSFVADIHTRSGNKVLSNMVQLTRSDNSIPNDEYMQGVFYVHNGTARIGDANFATGVEPAWHGYVNHKLYKKKDGTAKHTIEKWHSAKAAMRSLEDLGILCKWADTTESNATSVTLDVIGSITLGVSEAPRVGSWNGQYKFGITPVYSEGQEGPISECIQIKNSDGTTISNPYAYFDRSAIQIEVYISTGEIGTVVDNDAHLLGDERINAVRIYVQQEADENWYRLFHCSLEHGHKKSNWMHTYNGDTDVAKGIITGGDITSSSFGSNSGGLEHSTTVTVDFGDNYASTNGKTYILQLHGFHQTPVTRTFESDGSEEQDIVFPAVVNPQNTSGEAINFKFLAALLNETYFPVMTKKFSVSIADSSFVPPSEEEDKILEDAYEHLTDEDYL